MILIKEIKNYSDELGNSIVGQPLSSTGSFIQFKGRNCRVEIAEGVRMDNLSLKLEGENAFFKVGKNSVIKGWYRISHHSQLIIGNNLWTSNGSTISACEGTSIEIGDDCMFATANEIRSDHGHPIFCRITGKRTNKSKSVKIGNHVWLSKNAVIMPGSTVDDGSIIGYGSIVLGTHIETNCLAVGVPARIVRRDIMWDKVNIGQTPPYQFNDISDLEN